MIGEAILHYKILEKLGQGGMGVVYLAEDTKLERKVAIKFLPHNISSSSDERARFKVEAKASAALNHPNIATIHSIEEYGNDMFIVMEYIDGKELKNLVGTGHAPSMQVMEVINYATQLADGLEAAHKKGIVHRDIKSQNIMITEEGKVKIMDFGLAKISGGTQLTKMGATVGTISYMSPEQSRGEAVDQRTDIWSFGVVLYEMLTGVLPFKGDYDQAVIYSIMNVEPQSISELRKDIQNNLQEVVKKSLAKNPDKRYQHMSEVIEDLNKPSTQSISSAGKANPALAEPEPSIAVLAFSNMSGDPDQEFFSDGISEEIINMLAQVPGLKVAGRISSFSFKGKNQDLREIGEKLNVNHILEGSVRKSGNKLRITAQLIKVADGYHLWAEKFDRELEDIFDIQDEIALAILNAIKIKLLAADKEVVLKRYTDNTEAYELYLRGRSFITQFSAEPVSKALKYFEAAINIELEYALAYTGIAYCYLILWFFNHLPPEESLPGMLKAARKSLELDNDISETHTAIARVKLYYEWDLKGAVIEFQKAIKLNPNMAESREHYAFCLATLGNNKEAIEQAKVAYSVDPLSLITNFDVASLYWLVGDYEKQLEIGRNMIAMEPNFWGGHDIVSFALMNLKRYQESIVEGELAVNKSYDCFTLMYMGIVYGVIGDKTKVREVLQKMKELTKDQSGYYYMAVMYMALGEFDHALAYFENAIDKREGYIVYVKFHIMYFPEFKQHPGTRLLFDKAGVLLD